jgi:hypothetical protein
MLPISLPFLWMDHDADTTGRSGVMLRYRDSRHYYCLGIERYDRLVLWKREDRNWVALDARLFTFQRDRYYELRLEGHGRTLRGYLDGVLMLCAEDDTFPIGQAGIRSNCRSRFDGVRVFTTPSGQTAFINSRSEYDAKVAELGERYPKPVLERKIELGDMDSSAFRFGHLGPGPGLGVLLYKGAPESGGPGRIRAIDLEGGVLWETEGTITRLKLGDLDGDSRDEVIAIVDGKLAVLGGQTGECRAEFPVPSDEEGGPRGVYLCNLRGGTIPQDIVIKESEEHAAAYDRDLNLCWRKHGGYAHHLDFYAVDGDGCAESLSGFEMWRGDGSLLWRMEDADYIWTHPDGSAIGLFDSEGPQVALVVGGEGFIQIDGRTGRIRRRHYIGHAQSVVAGNYRPDREGLELWVTTWWGNPGIMTLFSGEGETLYAFEPSNIGGGDWAVNWSGDGEELVLIYCWPRNDWDLHPINGLYDAWGRRVVPLLPEMSRLSGAQLANVVGDSRDEMILSDGRALYIYTQDRPFSGERIYAPERLGRIYDAPRVSQPGWK